MSKISPAVSSHISRRSTLPALAAVVALFWLALGCAGCGEKEKGFAEFKAEGLAFVGSGNDEQALVSLRRATLLKPADRETLYFLGIVHGNLNQLDSSVSYLRRVIKLYGPDEETCRNLYTVASAAEMWDEAIEALNQLVELGVPRRDLYDRLYDAFMGASYYVAAGAIVDTLLRLYPERGELYLRSANISGLLGDYAKGEMAAQEALRRFGPSVEAYGNLGVLYTRQGKSGKAILFFRKALALDSAREASWINLGNALSNSSRRKEKREAIAAFQRVNPLLSHQLRLDTIVTRLQAELGD
ncbi:MAG: tetratricopeptide repeat protein [Candidatus Zixiibacteriota bacterium]